MLDDLKIIWYSTAEEIAEKYLKDFQLRGEQNPSLYCEVDTTINSLAEKIKPQHSWVYVAEGSLDVHLWKDEQATDGDIIEVLGNVVGYILEHRERKNPLKAMGRERNYGAAARKAYELLSGKERS